MLSRVDLNLKVFYETVALKLTALRKELCSSFISSRSRSSSFTLFTRSTRCAEVRRYENTSRDISYRLTSRKRLKTQNRHKLSARKSIAGNISAMCRCA
jgi:hypothetical protein